MTLTPDEFAAQHTRRFGTANPARMDVPFWLWMVREGPSAYGACQRLGQASAQGPVWCFDRFGMTRTPLSDGRTLCVAGEHEDAYDPDFCIYNDLIVLGPGDGVAIYGYPRELFPPTDFHSATLVGDGLVLIGSLGYQDERHPGETPVYRLDTATYAIKPVVTEGDRPGWISRHEAELVGDGIVVRGGQILGADGHATWRDNLEEYRLDLGTRRWTQLTDRRHWRQLLVRVDGWLTDLAWPWWRTVLRDSTVPYTLLERPELTDDDDEETDWMTCRIAVQDVPIRLTEELQALRLVVEGTLPEPVVAQLAADLARNLQAETGRACHIEEL